MSDGASVPEPAILDLSYEARRAFILANTRLQRPPHAPELQLHLADEITPIWRMTEEALGRIGLPPPFWAFAWAGGQALARYVLDHPVEVAGRRVLDFATGSGLVAIAAMAAGAQSTLACDVDDVCAAAVALNAEANGVEIAFTAENLLRRAPPDVDVIVAGDICYEQPMTGEVLAWLQKAQRSGTRVLIGDPGRTYFPREGLVRLAEYQVATTRELEDREVKRTCVWTWDASVDLSPQGGEHADSGGGHESRRQKPTSQSGAWVEKAPMTSRRPPAA